MSVEAAARECYLQCRENERERLASVHDALEVKVLEAFENVAEVAWSARRRGRAAVARTSESASTASLTPSHL